MESCWKGTSLDEIIWLKYRWEVPGRKNVMRDKVTQRGIFVQVLSRWSKQRDENIRQRRSKHLMLRIKWWDGKAGRSTYAYVCVDEVNVLLTRQDHSLRKSRYLSFLKKRIRRIEYPKKIRLASQKKCLITKE